MENYHIVICSITKKECYPDINKCERCKIGQKQEDIKFIEYHKKSIKSIEKRIKTY